MGMAGGHGDEPMGRARSDLNKISASQRYKDESNSSKVLNGRNIMMSHTISGDAGHAGGPQQRVKANNFVNSVSGLSQQSNPGSQFQNTFGAQANPGLMLAEARNAHNQTGGGKPFPHSTKNGGPNSQLNHTYQTTKDQSLGIGPAPGYSISTQ